MMPTQCLRADYTLVLRYNKVSFLLSGGLLMKYKKYMCVVCGWVYDEEYGVPEDGIEPGTRWDEIPLNWTCPECGARKSDFEMVELA